MLNQPTIIGPLKIMGMFFLAALLGASNAQAGWLIDHEKFHASFHGQTSCSDCHADINDRPRHPDPANVNKPSSDFFDVERCLACHDHILEDLDQGIHGSKKIAEHRSYENCIECHPPHAELPPQDRFDTFDPERPLEKQCGICHEPENELPSSAAEDRDCMTCHLQPGLADARAAEKISRMCLHCHGQVQTAAPAEAAAAVPLLNTIDYQKQAHAKIACNQCHQQAAAYKHSSQQLAECRQCHPPHDEKVAHDAHLRVACEACHLQGVQAVSDSESQQVLWKKNQVGGEPSKIHQLVEFDDESFCRRCHYQDNAIGAAAMVLPAKSMLCMPCHAATLSLGDTTTILTLVGFLGGMVLTFALIFSGAGRPRTGIDHSGKDAKAVDRTRKFAFGIKAILWDVFFQRRLFRQSQIRWLIHGLIFFPLVIRFLWGLVALSASLTMPEHSWIWGMLDKNNALTGFLFDLTGLMILIGVILALIRGRVQRTGQIVGLPGQDRMALILIGSIVLVGFVLEGMRIAMTGTPQSAAYAFVGVSISRLFSRPSGLSNLYGYGWYLHAILTGIFIVYLPFSRLLHMILSPVVLAWNAVAEHK